MKISQIEKPEYSFSKKLHALAHRNSRKTSGSSGPENCGKREIDNRRTEVQPGYVSISSQQIGVPDYGRGKNCFSKSTTSSNVQTVHTSSERHYINKMFSFLDKVPRDKDMQLLIKKSVDLLQTELS